MPLRFTLYLALLALGITAANPTQAHEFWFAPIASPQPVGATVTLRLEVGEFFNGDAAGFSIPTTQALRHITATDQEDLKPFLPAQAREAEVALALETPGIHVLAYDSNPLQLTLEAGRFQAYLHDEGLDFIKTQREQSGTNSLPGRERYRRHIKTLVAVSPKARGQQPPDRTWAKPTGQRLEITPLANPLTLKPGGDLPLRIQFDNQPLAGALVKAWHKHKGQLVLLRSTTSGQGQVEFSLPYAGDWMISVVHMIPASDADKAGPDPVDWDSHWGNLSFHMPSP